MSNDQIKNVTSANASSIKKIEVAFEATLQYSLYQGIAIISHLN